MHPVAQRVGGQPVAKRGSVAKRGALARTLPIAQRGTPPVLLFFYFALPLLLRPSRRASVLSPSRSGGLVNDQ